MGIVLMHHLRGWGILITYPLHILILVEFLPITWVFFQAPQQLGFRTGSTEACVYILAPQQLGLLPTGSPEACVYLTNQMEATNPPEDNYKGEGLRTPLLQV